MNKLLIKGALVALWRVVLALLVLCASRCGGEVDHCGIPASSIFMQHCTCAGIPTEADLLCSGLEEFPIENATFSNITCL